MKTRPLTKSLLLAAVSQACFMTYHLPAQGDPKPMTSEQAEIETFKNEAVAAKKQLLALGLYDPAISAEFSAMEKDVKETDDFFVLRDKIGELAGAKAGEIFGKGPFVIWGRQRWLDVGMNEWPSQEAVAQKIDLQVDTARNLWSTESFVITNVTGKPIDVAVALKNLPAGMKGALRFGYYISCPDLKYRTDALVLIDGTFRLGAGQSTRIWVELNGGDAAPDEYRAEVVVSSGEMERSVPLSVAVHGVDIPDKREEKVLVYDYVLSMMLVRGLEKEAIEDLKNRGINVHIIGGGTKVAADAEGNLTGPPDYTELDRQIRFYREHNPGCELALFWGGDINHHLGFFPNLTFLSDPWKKAMSAYYRDFVAHLHRLGLSNEDFFMYVYDETTADEVRQVYELLKSVEPSVRLSVNPTVGHAGDIPPRQEIENIAPFVDIWIPNYESVVKGDPELFEFIRTTAAKSEKELWIYSCQNGSNIPIYPYNLQRHWFAWNAGLKGVAQWAYADKLGGDNRNTWKWALGGFNHIYTQDSAPIPLKEKLTPSARWLAWREGMQDYQLAAMVAKKAGNDQAQRKVLQDQVDFVLADPDPARADQARRKLLMALE